MNKQRFLILLFLIPLFTACSTLKVDQEKLSNIKSVAIIGIEVRQQMPNEISLNLASGKVESTKPMQNIVGQPKKFVVNIYNDARRQLQKQMKWKVMSYRRLATHPSYKKLFQKKMSGWRNVYAPGEGKEVFIAKDIMDYSATFKDISESEAAQLRKALGVDALVVIDFDMELLKKASLANLYGGGEYQLSSMGKLIVYTDSPFQPIWSDYNLRQKSPERISHWAGATSLSKVFQQATNLAKTTFSRAFNNLEKEKAKNVEKL